MLLLFFATVVFKSVVCELERHCVVNLVAIEYLKFPRLNTVLLCLNFILVFMTVV